MEPVGATASALTILAAAAGVTKLIKSIVNAPQELTALTEEVAQLSLTISEVAAFNSETEARGATGKALSKALSKAQLKIAELNTYVQSLPREPAKSFGARWKIKWVAKAKRKAQHLLDEFKSIRYDLALALTVHASRASSDQQETESRLLGDSLNDQLVLSGKIHSQTEAIFDQLKDLSLQPAGPAITNSWVDPTEIMSELHSNRSSLGNIQAELQAISSLLIGRGSTQTQRSEKQPVRRDSAVGLEKTSIGMDGQNVYVSTSPSYTASASTICRCSCHGGTISPVNADSETVIGQLFISQKRSGSSKTCPKLCCPSGSSTEGKALYIFPRWVATWVFSLSWAKAQGRDLSVRIKVRTYSGDEELFRLVELGDLTGVKAMVTEKKVSPDEIERHYGQTALVWSINREKTEIFQYLLNEGADPDIEDFSGRSVRTVAMMQFFVNLHTSDRKKQLLSDYLKRLFWVGGQWEDLGVSRAQQIVLGMSEGNLKEELEKHDCNIDYQDASGRTALYWSATSNNISALRILLEHHANPDIRDDHGSSPINAAACSKKGSAALELLLKYNADTSPPKKNGFTPLLHAAFHKNDLAFIEPLVEAGCDVNAIEVRGMNSLARAALRDNDATARYLLCRGADVGNVDFQGYSVLATAVQSGANNVLALLTMNGASYQTVTKIGRTILHLAAASRASNVETLSLLQGLQMHDVDVNAKDEAGDTAVDLLHERSDVDEDYRRAFARLLGSVKSLEPESYGPEVDFYSLL